MAIESIKKIVPPLTTTSSDHVSENPTTLNSLGRIATGLSSEKDLDMYFKPRPDATACNHAVAVVAATAAVVSAVSSVVSAQGRRGRTLDTSFSMDLKGNLVSGLDVTRLMEIRSENL